MADDEKILKSNISLDKDSEEYKQLFRTKDIQIASFLLARGYELLGMESVLINSMPNKHRPLFFFLFRHINPVTGKPDVTEIEKFVLNFHNMNRNSLNVNVNSLFQSYKNIRSLVTNPPFTK